MLTAIAHYHLLPESYIYGLADVRMIADFYSSYVLGKTYPHGVWFYFPLAMPIKSTLPFSGIARDSGVGDRHAQVDALA